MRPLRGAPRRGPWTPAMAGAVAVLSASLSAGCGNQPASGEPAAKAPQVAQTAPATGAAKAKGRPKVDTTSRHERNAARAAAGGAP